MSQDTNSNGTTAAPKTQNAVWAWLGKQPVLLPLVAVAHIVALVYTTITAVQLGTDSSWFWLQPLWMLLYTICWLSVCNLKKWGLYSYLMLTILNTVLYVAIKDVYWRDVFSSNLFLVDILFSFFLIIYFKRFK